MKKLFIASILAVASFGVAAQSVNLFAGGVNATAAGGSLAGSTSQSGAALAGLTFTGGQAQTSQAAEAGGTVTKNGVLVGQGSTAQGSSGTVSGALGFAGGNSQATGGSGNVAGATGTFRTIGLGFGL